MYSILSGLNTSNNAYVQLVTRANLKKCRQLVRDILFGKWHHLMKKYTVTHKTIQVSATMNRILKVGNQMKVLTTTPVPPPWLSMVEISQVSLFLGAIILYRIILRDRKVSPSILPHFMHIFTHIVTKLDHIPTIGYSLPFLSLFSALKFLFIGRNVVEEGYRKVNFLWYQFLAFRWSRISIQVVYGSCQC